MKTIITRIELEGTDNMRTIDVGFTTDQEIINQINEDYDATLGKFLGENRTKLEINEISVSVFFESTPSVNEARATTDDTVGLVEITNINEI